MKKINNTQEKILQAAKKVYCQVGYTSSTFQLIAKESDTSRSLINYYYSKKQDILVDLLGRHLESIHAYIRQFNKYGSLMTYMLTNAIYTKSMFASENTIRFHTDVLQRNDKDLGPYTNYNSLYENILKEFNINISKEDLLYKEIAIFGASSELIINYLNKNIEVNQDKLIELILHNTCNLLHVNNYEINNALAGLWDEYAALDQKIFYLFE